MQPPVENSESAGPQVDSAATAVEADRGFAPEIEPPPPPPAAQYV